jgi:agmatinase
MAEYDIVTHKRKAEGIEYYLGLPFSFSGLQSKLEEAGVVVYGVPLDSTSSFKKGTSFGPNAVRECSLEIDLYSPDHGKQFCDDLKIHDLGDIWVTRGDVAKTLQRVGELSSKIVGMGKIPLVLGGEHLVTLGCLQAFKKRDFVLVQFDAHSDLRDEYTGDTLSHTTVMNRALDFVKPKNLVQLGIRSLTKEDHELIKKRGINTFFAKDIAADVAGVAGKLSALTEGKDVYITFDIDALDAPYVPGTGTPEPGGLSYWQAIELIRAIKGRVIGLDMVEVGRDAELLTPSTAAKLIYELLLLPGLRR